MPPETPRPPDAHRKLLWWTFWLLFLSTPVLAIAGPALIPKFLGVRMGPMIGRFGLIGLVGGILGGGFGAGFVLAKLYSANTAEMIRRGIAFGMAILATYGVIAGVGCAFLLSAYR